MHFAIGGQRRWTAPGPDRPRCRALMRDGEALATEITWQMGRPIGQSPGEIRGLEERARYMLAEAPRALADRRSGAKPGFTRFIRHEPLGLVFVMAPWNYPYLTAINSIVPALAAGNVVLLKHSAQTPLCAERFQAGIRLAGLPPGVFQHLHLDHDAALADRGQRCCPAGGVHGLGRRRPRRAGGGRGNLHRHQPGTRRQGPGLCARGCRSRPSRREPGRWRMLQLGPELLRHRADLRP